MTASRPARCAPLRPLVIALGCALLAACAARPPEAPPGPAAGWQAAIGALEIAGEPEICTAVLVRPDLIATTSHCLHPRGRVISAGLITFTSSAGAEKSQGVAIIKQGGNIVPGTIHQDQAQTDWALVRIAPPLSRIGPIAIAPMSAASARARIAKGAVFYSAGYGSGAKDRLTPHRRCGLLPPDPKGQVEGDLFFATSCIIRLGDSGGPVALIIGSRPELIGLIVGFAQQPDTGESIGVV
ncbi:MAG: trypsin-like serine peptidase, partial [Dongiaceae bacterium]